MTYRLLVRAMDAQGVEDLEPRRMLSVSVAGSVLSIVGTEAADRIDVRASGSRLIVTGAGKRGLFALSSIRSVKIRALGGNDIIRVTANVRTNVDAGKGNDRIQGGAAADLIRGGEGNDQIKGGAGNDQIWGDGAGRHGLFSDVLDGGAGDDLLYGDEKNWIQPNAADGNDTLRGGAGNDTLGGGKGQDWLYGDDGDDRLSGCDGSDTLDGGEGNDLLFGGGEGSWRYDDADSLIGGPGDDDLDGGNFTWNPTKPDSHQDQLFGGPGNDDDNDVGEDLSDESLEDEGPNSLTA